MNPFPVTVESERSRCAFIITNLHLSRKLILIFLPKRALYRSALYIHIVTSGTFSEQQLVTEPLCWGSMCLAQRHLRLGLSASLGSPTLGKTTMSRAEWMLRKSMKLISVTST